MTDSKCIQIKNEEIIEFFKVNDFINHEAFILKYINVYKENNINSNDNRDNNVKNNLFEEEYYNLVQSLTTLTHKYDKLYKELSNLNLENIDIINKKSQPIINSVDNTNYNKIYCNFCKTFSKDILPETNEKNKDINKKNYRSLRTHQNVHCKFNPKNNSNTIFIDDNIILENDNIITSDGSVSSDDNDSIEEEN
jgi:hypothetical protein